MHCAPAVYHRIIFHACNYQVVKSFLLEARLTYFYKDLRRKDQCRTAVDKYILLVVHISHWPDTRCH
jgi:uncharacterized membrane protein